jgi:hypothetical protein
VLVWYDCSRRISLACKFLLIVNHRLSKKLPLPMTASMFSAIRSMRIT